MNKEELYNVKNYSDNDLFDMLDLTNPSDRELEAKILMNIDKYDEIDDPISKKFKLFFENVYKHFFEEEEEEEEEEEYKSTNKNGLQEGFVSNRNQNPAQNNNNNTQLSRRNVSTPREVITTNSIEYGKSKLNPLLKETQKRILQLDSAFRDFENYKSSTDYLINLSEELHNVVSLKLHSISIPYTWYNVSNIYDANYFLLKGLTPGVKDNYEFKFEIVAGTYNINEIIDKKCIY